MTDKKIIIDGIDVTGCEWISEVGLDSEYICNCNSPNKTSGYCKYNPNCCYKQLKRKEQECEELKKEIKTKTYHWEQCTEEILKGTKQFVDRMEKAEKTLTEIKEFVKNEMIPNCDTSIILQKSAR